GGPAARLREICLMGMSVALYGASLAMQTLRHRQYFIGADEEIASGPGIADLRPAYYHGALLVFYIVPIIVLSKKSAVPIDYGVTVAGAPAGLVGFIVAALILSPESLGAVRAALATQLQRSINLLPGSALATISPAH